MSDDDYTIYIKNILQKLYFGGYEIIRKSLQVHAKSLSDALGSYQKNACGVGLRRLCGASAFTAGVLIVCHIFARKADLIPASQWLAPTVMDVAPTVTDEIHHRILFSPIFWREFAMSNSIAMKGSLMRLHMSPHTNNLIPLLQVIYDWLITHCTQGDYGLRVSSQILACFRSRKRSSSPSNDIANQE